MFRTNCIQFSLIEAEFIQDYQNLAENVTNLQLLNITATPSAQRGLEILSQDWFKTKVLNKQNLLGLNFKIDEEIDEKYSDKPQFYELNRNFFIESFLVGFQSTLGGHESMTYWKVPNHEQFYSIYIDDDEIENLTNYLQYFLIEEIQNGRCGILKNYQHKQRINLQDIGDIDDNNLLIIATIKLQSNIIQNLLNHDFDADDAIDAAWEMFCEYHENEDLKNAANEIILSLLKSNSRFPNDFEYDKASQEVKEFIEMCESLHKDVDKDDFDALKLKIDLEPNLMYFYNRANKSLLNHSLQTRKFRIFKLLSKQISTGCDEDLDEVYKNMNKNEKSKLREMHKLNAVELPEIYILILRSKSKITKNDRFLHQKWKYIDEAYETLNSNQYCKKIMKLATKFKKLKIYFDFKHDSTYYMDPTTSKYCKGIIYEKGSLFIGAKNLSDVKTKSEVIGVLAHELCHLAVFIAFANRNFDPFPTGESELKKRFVDLVMVQCRKREAFEYLIANVFTSYPKDMQDSEMIVTIPQMMMLYIQNDARLEELEEIFEELFTYSREIVEPELNRASSVLEKLDSEDMALRFKKLTEPMKAAILHAEIIFNGSKTSFFELIGDDQEIMQLLSPEDIKKFILESKPIQIGSYVEPEFKYGVIERRFEELTKKNKNSPALKKKSEKQKQKTFQTIQEETKNSKIFILADHAGTGKTTTFKYSADKLKKSTSSAFVSFINLRKHGKIFEKYQNDPNSLNLQQVCELLLQILNLQTKIEIEIFKKLFSTGKVIFFFDGVDEICPKYTKLVMKIFQILSESETANQLWISTRLHHAKTLQLLHPTVHKFVPYTKEEKENFVKTILQVNRILENQNETATKIVEYVKKLEGYYYESKEIDNPLMIQIITELYIRNKAELDTSNRIEIYKAMIEKQKEEVGDKVPISERDKDSAFSIWDAHRVLAFKLIFGDDYEKELKFKLDQMPIMQKWQKERKNFTSDMIQRYGFVIVDLDDLEDERSSIDFMHRTYAEYFVAKYLIDFIYDESGRSNDDEDKMKFKLFAVVIERPKKFKVVRDFIVSFVKSQGPEMIVKTAFKSLILEHIKKTLNLKRPRFFEVSVKLGRDLTN